MCSAEMPFELFHHNGTKVDYFPVLALGLSVGPGKLSQIHVHFFGSCDYIVYTVVSIGLTLP